MPRLHRLRLGLLCDGNQHRGRPVGRVLRGLVGAFVLCDRHGGAAFGERGGRTEFGPGCARDALALVAWRFGRVADGIRFGSFDVGVVAFFERVDERRHCRYHDRHRCRGVVDCVRRRVSAFAIQEACGWGGDDGSSGGNAKGRASAVEWSGRGLWAGRSSVAGADG